VGFHSTYNANLALRHFEEEVTNMEEKINVEFTGEEFDLILKYMDAVEATTVQNAILNAISIALDDSDNK
jgi:hypothetical protein